MVYRLAAALGLMLLTAESWAVEPAKYGDRFALVGIISEDAASGQGIVVLRDRLTKKTLTLRGGAALPEAGALKVGAIRHRKVVLSDGQETIELTYADLDQEPAAQASGAPVSHRASMGPTAFTFRCRTPSRCRSRVCGQSALTATPSPQWDWKRKPILIQFRHERRFARILGRRSTWTTTVTSRSGFRRIDSVTP